MPTLRGDLSIVALILLAFWTVGSVSSYTMGGFIHVFLLVAVCMMLPRFIRGRKATM
jgi:hypothetical protein